LRRGAPITHFFLIISGLVRVQGNDENSSEASCLFPGDYFGEGRFLSGCKDSPKTYACMKDVSLCLIPEKLFEDVKEFGKVQEQIISDRAIEKEANSRTGRRKRSISIGKPTPEILDKHETNPNPTAFCFLLDFFP
jgi:CRP-like cAMP-binding protein